MTFQKNWNDFETFENILKAARKFRYLNNYFKAFSKILKAFKNISKLCKNILKTCWIILKK